MRPYLLRRLTYGERGVRGLHRFLLTRSAVMVVSVLCSAVPGGHFAEGDRVEDPTEPSSAEAPLAEPNLARLDLDEARGITTAPGRPERPVQEPHVDRWAARLSPALTVERSSSALSLSRIARGEGQLVELAQLDAQSADFGVDTFH